MAAATSTPLMPGSYAPQLHVDENYGPVVRLSCSDRGNPEQEPQIKDFPPGHYVLGRSSPFLIDSRSCSRHQADLLVSSHTVAVTRRGKPAMRLTRAEGGDAFVMASERNYQIFDGDVVDLGNTKYQVTFSFVGKLKEIETALAAKEAERKAAGKPDASKPAKPDEESGSD